MIEAATLICKAGAGSALHCGRKKTVAKERRARVNVPETLKE